MLNHVQLDKVLVLDLETVPMVEDYESLPEDLQPLWDEKAARINRPDESKTPEDLFSRAGIYAEFGRIVCISFGIFNKIDQPISGDDHQYQFRIKSFSGEDERKILINFIELLDNHFKPNQHYLCAHNGQEFDFPYLARRILIHGFKIPDMLDIAGKKPWETKHLLDTMQLWKFGDYKHFTSLKLLTTIFNIPTPKEDIKGSDVHRVFYEEGDVDRIVEYCQKDVLATGRLLMKFKGMPILRDDEVVMVDEEG